MILCLLLGLAVVLAVAVPARRAGRDLLTERGEHVVARVKERTDHVATVTRERTGDLIATAKDKVTDVRGRPDDSSTEPAQAVAHQPEAR